MRARRVPPPCACSSRGIPRSSAGRNGRNDSGPAGDAEVMWRRQRLGGGGGMWRETRRSYGGGVIGWLGSPGGPPSPLSLPLAALPPPLSPSPSLPPSLHRSLSSPLSTLPPHSLSLSCARPSASAFVADGAAAWSSASGAPLGRICAEQTPRPCLSLDGYEIG